MARIVLWMDVETTGLDQFNGEILEVTAIVTDHQLKELGRYHAVIGKNEADLEKLNPWCKKTHGDSGLLSECLESTTTIEQAEQQIILLLQNYSTEKRTLLGGNSVHFDKKWAEVHFPLLNEWLNYRLLDVSAIKEALSVLFDIQIKKTGTPHRSTPDIEHSIREFKIYAQLLCHGAAAMPDSTWEGL